MGFLRRAFGADSDPSPDPILALTRQAAAGGDRVYTRATCPYCEAVLAKLPGRSAKCPACREHIAYVRGADDLVYLVRDSEADFVRAEVDAHWAVDQDWTGGRRDVDGLHRYCRTFRGRYAALGVRVWISPGDESCADCRGRQGRLLDPATAPDLPLRDCRRRYCFCRYHPTLGDRPPA